MSLRLICAIAMMATTVTVTAQNLVEQINAIKLDPQYLYGEASHENADTAFMAALFDLKMIIDAKLKTQLDPSLLKNKVQKLSRPRGQHFKVMVYIKNEDVFDIHSAVPSTPTESPQKDVTGNIVTMSPTPPPSLRTPSSAPVSTPDLTAFVTPSLSHLVNELMDTEHLQEAMMVLEGHNRRGTVGEFVPYSKTQHPQTMYLLIFDREYNIPLAVLTPEKPNGKRDNLYKNLEDSLSNYSDKIAVCFTLK